MDAVVHLRELTDANRDEVLALQVTEDQGNFVSSVAESLDEAAENPQGSPWFRAVYDGDTPIGFVMLSWDCVPNPPEIRGPWFLWKLLIDERFQRRGYGRVVVELIAELVRAEGGEELLSSCVADGDGAPWPFYEGIGFVPTGDLDGDEIIICLDLRSRV